MIRKATPSPPFVRPPKVLVILDHSPVGSAAGRDERFCGWRACVIALPCVVAEMFLLTGSPNGARASRISLRRSQLPAFSPAEQSRAFSAEPLHRQPILCRGLFPAEAPPTPDWSGGWLPAGVGTALLAQCVVFAHGPLAHAVAWLPDHGFQAEFLGRAPTPADVAAGERIVEMIRTADGPVLSEDGGFVVAAGKPWSAIQRISGPSTSPATGNPPDLFPTCRRNASASWSSTPSCIRPPSSPPSAAPTAS